MVDEKTRPVLLIDGNNLCYRVWWTNRHLAFKGRPTGLLFGFLRSLVAFRRRFSGHEFIIAWDSRSKRRTEEAEAAVEAGLVPSGYKATREKREEMDEMFEQMDQLKEILCCVRVAQIGAKGVEADDLIYTLGRMAGRHRPVVVVSSDRDFYQMLSDRVSVYDAMKKETWTGLRFEQEFAYPPRLHVDAGALAGDSSDNIHGVDDWGPKTSGKYVRKYGDVEAIITALQEKDAPTKTEQKLLDSVDRVRLAKSLKKMDLVGGIDWPQTPPGDPKRLREALVECGCASLLANVMTLARAG